jgi:uncharacterized LabA/DUF88 family protein
VTTQNTHHEQSDVDATVVEHPPVPESTVDPSTPETVTPAGTEVQAEDAPSNEPATPAEVQAEAPQAAPESPEAPSTQIEELSAEQGASLQAEEGTSEPAFVAAITTPTEESAEAAPADSTPAPTSEEVRSFTDFIEEFRQAEEARLSVARQEGQAEAFQLLPSEADAPGIASPDAADESLPFSAFPVDLAPEILAIETPLENSPDLPTAVQEETTPATEQPTAPTTIPERAVSPLLRPATRLRLPRHGVNRHNRDEVKDRPTPESAPQLEQPVQSTTSEAATEPEQPRPARRYRFDRPANNGSTGTTGSMLAVQPAQPRSEESRDSQQRGPAARPEVTQNGDEQQTDTLAAKPALSNTPLVKQIAESPAQKQPAAQETPAAEAPTSDHNRRRQGQDRHKEQLTALTANDATAPAPSVTEPAPQTGEVAPEDLPPLEYAELQKASTRRRRRHRTGPSSGPVTPATETPPIIPAQPTPAAAPIIPAAAAVPAPTPTRPAAAAAEANGSLYSIVSGYTVSQMNQGNETTGPFMGPEPSPARGSVVTRDGRTTRAETQRTPGFTPGRTHEGGSSAASLNHFANVISQSFQTQTDRMVAELRRSSQSPTNVSVTLPPFPSTERVGVFVDVANLLYSARTLRIAVDFGKLLDFLRGNRRLVRAHAYCPTSPQAGDEQMFLQAVKGLGYRITTKNYKTFSSGAKKADLDLDLCMDVVRLVDGGAVDCIVLVSGDSDFMPMLDYCSDHGVRVEVAAFDEAMSATLRQSCDLFINLSMLEEIRS